MDEKFVFDGDSSNYVPKTRRFPVPYGVTVLYSYNGPPLHFEPDGVMAMEYNRMMHEQLRDEQTTKAEPANTDGERLRAALQPFADAVARNQLFEPDRDQGLNSLSAEGLTEGHLWDALAALAHPPQI